MITFKPCIKYKRADGLYQVYIRIIYKKKVRYIATEKWVNDKGLDRKKQIKDNFVLEYCHRKINLFLELLNKQNVDVWDIDYVVDFIKNGTTNLSFSKYARKYHADMYNRGQIRNAKNYELAYLHLERFAGTNNLFFEQMTSTFINSWIKSMQLTSRAKEMYPICIRQIFKQALLDYNDYDLGIIRIKTNPWSKVKIPKADTPQKKAITMEACRDFFYCQLPPSDRIFPLTELGRDVAMMCLCLAGINAIDLFELKKKDYKDGIICYERAKTRKARKDNAYMEMRVPDIIKPLFEKYTDSSDSEYLFNFHNTYSNYDSFNANVNGGIRKLCEKSLHLDPKKRETYSTYTFRHTWATVAQNNCGASIADVAFAMNHSDRYGITRGYVKIDFIQLGN